MSITSSTCRAGVAAFAVTGAIAVGLAAPSAYATTPSDDLQPTIDTLLNEMATAVAVDTAYFDTTPANEARLPEALQTLMYKNLATLLNQQSTVPYATRQPEMVAGPMANSRQFLGANNPDTIYYTQTIDPHATNVVTLDPGPGTVDATFTIANLSVTTPNAYTNVRLADLEPNADGTYTIYVSPTKPEGAVNWIPSITTDANGNELVGNTVAVRSTLGDWAAPPASLTFENLDGTLPTSANPGVSSTGLSDDAIGGLLGELAATTQISNGIWAVYYGDLIGRGPENGFTPIAGTIGPGSLPSQATSFGRFNLAPGEALIVTVPYIEGVYNGAHVTDVYAQALGYGAEQSSLNNTQVVLDPGGQTVTYVISATDPGVPNWLDTTGVDEGLILLRWQGYSDELPVDENGVPVAPQTVVVPIDEVMDNMPDGTPSVSPDERAAALKHRLFSFNYFLNASKDTSWVTLNLQLDDLEAAMGTENYEAVFGTTAAASLSARLGPELSPDWAPVLRAVLTNPAGSLSAILETLPQAVNNVQLPTMLAVVRLAKVVADTNQAVAEAMLEGNPVRGLVALGAGAKEFVAVLDKSLTDPSTSITAGLLNARDDLALQIGRADSYDNPTPQSVASSLSEVAQVTATNASTTVAMLREVGSRAIAEPAPAAAGQTNSPSQADDDSPTGDTVRAEARLAGADLSDANTVSRSISSLKSRVAENRARLKEDLSSRIESAKQDARDAVQHRSTLSPRLFDGRLGSRAAEAAEDGSVATPKAKGIVKRLAAAAKASDGSSAGGEE